VLSTKKPLLVDDARLHPLLDPVRDHLESRGITAIAVVPMLSEGEPVGVLFLRSSARGGFSEREISFLRTVANATAVALRNAQLESQHGRAILSFRDVTDSREMESELRKTKEFLERLIDATADGIVACDLRGRILLFNKGAERVTGYQASDVVGRMHVDQLYP